MSKVATLDTRGRELDHKRSYEARHSAVDGRDGCRAGIGSVTREASEDEDCGVVAKARGQRVDHLGVADELERDQPQRAADVVLVHVVHVTLDRGEHEVVDFAQVRKVVRNRVRLGEIESDTAGATADVGRGGDRVQGG